MPAVIRIRAVRGARRRPGFTLIEILVALVLLGIVVGGLLSVVSRQQRFYADAAGLIDMRENLRQVAGLLPSELRGVSPRHGDILDVADSAIAFKATTGTGVICTINAARTTIVIPPYAQASESGLTSWVSPPSPGDSIWVFDPRTSLPDTMYSYVVAGVAPNATCPAATGFTTAADQNSGWAITLLGAAPSPWPLPATVVVGGPVRFFKPVRYSLYRSPADSKWYVGYRDYNPLRAQPWSNIQPVSGPFMPYAAGGASGLSFAYADSAGNAINSGGMLERIRRIDVVVRGETAVPVKAAGFTKTPSGYVRDSLNLSIALRNR
ncbi:MAG TPA: prepilin-type N-terminal cleavage/methylation domain-containing protein [Gemmatimonadaceae bacterium]|nr:prepilin-type N-terminal cleavage/methylation domain-containing protein [Gemmatimonadaceae bacterium]